MRIGSLAARTGVSRRLLRYYEEQGLLRPGRLANGYREYPEASVGEVRHIRALLATGLQTRVIAGLLPCIHDEDDHVVPSPCPGMVTQLSDHRGRLDDDIAQLQESRRALDDLLAHATAPQRPPAG